MDYIINKLPWELHLPSSKREEVENGQFNELFSYSYCGPGTKFEDRVAQGYVGINHLDRLCKAHDEAYAAHSGRMGRVEADQALISGALDIVGDSKHDITERLYAFLVASYFGSISSKFVLGDRRADSFMYDHPSLKHIVKHIPSIPSKSSSILLSHLLKSNVLRKEILSESRQYNLFRNKFQSILFNKFRTSLLSSSSPEIDSSLPKFNSGFIKPRSSSFFSRFKRFFKRKKRVYRS